MFRSAKVAKHKTLPFNLRFLTGRVNLSSLGCNFFMLIVKSVLKFFWGQQLQIEGIFGAS